MQIMRQLFPNASAMARILCGLVIACGAILPSPLLSAEEKPPVARPNILFLVADDLATRLGCYGDTAAITPNLDRLAAEGVVFSHAYCQGAVCTPSRTSFMLGRRVPPDFFRKHPDTMTLGRWFRQHGYQTFSVGKIDHTEEYVDPEAWDIRVATVKPAVPLGPRTQWHEDLGLKRQKLSFIGVAATAEALLDHARTDRAIEFLERERDASKPFFAAVGFHTPHVPWDTTKACFDAHDPATFAVEPTPADASPLPPGSLRDEPGMEISEAHQRDGIRAYYAAVTMLDEQIGRLLAELNRRGLLDNTVIVFTSDHGYHLGWRGQWCKHSIDEQVMRVPLIVRAAQGATGAKADGIVELLDLFPTFCDIAGLPAADGLAGRSFLPLVKDPQAKGKAGGCCQWGNGRTIRTARYRYTERTDGSRELYDHERDPAEYFNVIDEPGSDAIAREHAALLDKELGPKPKAKRKQTAHVTPPVDDCPAPGSFAGVGMLLRTEDQKVVISEVLPDTPAARAGLVPGLVIRTIDGSEMDGVNFEGWRATLQSRIDVRTIDGSEMDGVALRRSIDMIRGQPGTKVRIELVDRKIDHTRTVELVRETLPVVR